MITVLPLLFLAQFFAGAFLCNAVPHLVAGLQGQPFPTPFAKPHGVGDSSPLVNFWWGLLNLLLAFALLGAAPIHLGVNSACLAAVLGAAVVGTFAALHFGKVRRAK